jgi:hypothetical protein
MQSGSGLRRRSRLHPVVVLAVLGAMWGAATYEILWGSTSIVVTRRYVDSVAGLLTLLPARIVLYAIHFVEDRIAGHPFALSRADRWIGFVIAAVGAGLLAGAYVVGRAVTGMARGRMGHAGARRGPT